MSLVDLQLDGPVDKVEQSIAAIKLFAGATDNPLIVATSGGKDSVCVMELVRLAGVAAEYHYHVTGIDPPELVRFIREGHPQVVFDQPRIPFLRRLTEKGMPLRQRRWCCEEYKERKFPGRVVVTGIRRSESLRRARRRQFETCMKERTQRYLHPILEWSEEDVWEFIRSRGLAYCSLYDEGFRRLGCVMCPVASVRERERERLRWPRYAEAFKRAFERLYEKNRDARAYTGKWKNGEDMFRWWLRNDPSPNPAQLNMYDDDDGTVPANGDGGTEP